MEEKILEPTEQDKEKIQEAEQKSSKTRWYIVIIVTIILLIVGTGLSTWMRLKENTPSDISLVEYEARMQNQQVTPTQGTIEEEVDEIKIEDIEVDLKGVESDFSQL